MDFFDAAARRLEKDQSKIRGRTRGHGAVISEKAKREAEFSKKEQEKVREERERKQRQQEHLQQYFMSCERGLGVRSLAEGGLKLQATSIYGDGDKIALPPSLLQQLTNVLGDDGVFSSPLTFRIGLLNPKYSFPGSSALIDMNLAGEYDDAMDDSDGDENGSMIAYLAELSHKYISYAYGNVVEFTQEEGHIGLPISIASYLLNVESDSIVPTTRTKDRAGNDKEKSIDTDDDHTAGHLYWGGFDIPDMPLEISLVKLPKGRKCTLVPTREAVLNGFYNLNDVKLVLEMSLVRSRATLSLNNVIHTWHRGVQYDLTVTKVSPSDYGAISCIDTDIEVDLGTNEEVEREIAKAKLVSAASTQLSPPKPVDMTKSLGTGYKLSETEPHHLVEPEHMAILPLLLPEPPSDQAEDVCTVQISADGKTGRRRLDIKVARVGDLFTFASSMIQRDPKSFRLVTRFPRRTLTFSDQILEEAGIEAGQALFLVEII